jgi:predicted outer membrane protein
MQKIIVIITCSFLFINYLKAAIQPGENPIKTHRPRSILTTQEAGFLINAAGACMMGIKEGGSAKSKSRNAVVRNYGELMMKENTLILSRVRRLANDKKFILPSAITKEKLATLTALNSNNNKKFDKMFIGMTKADYKKDLREFKRASRFKNKQISVFASEQLPMLQSQLDRLRAIKI